MTDWQQEFAESIGWMTESGPADEERILGVKIGHMKIRQLKRLLKHGDGSDYKTRSRIPKTTYRATALGKGPACRRASTGHRPKVKRSEPPIEELDLIQ